MIEESKKELCLSELLYLLYFMVMFGARAIGLYEGMTVYNISLVIGMLLFTVKVMMTEHTLGEYLIMGAMLLLSVLVYYNTGEKGLLLYFTMMLGMKKVSLKRVLQLAAVFLTAAFTLLVLLSVTGWIQDITYVHDRTGFGRIIRHSLGYPYPNTLFTTYIVLMALLMLCFEKQTKTGLFLMTVMLAVYAVYIYLYSCSNTGVIVAFFYLAVNLYLQLRPKLSTIEKAGILCVYPGCLLLSIAGPLITVNHEKLFRLMDKVLHNRWAYSYYYLKNEPVTLFGTRFQPAPNDNYMVDSSFLYSFLQIGVIPFLLVTALMLFMIGSYVKKQKKTELAIIVSFCLLGLSDPFFFNLSYKNIMFLFIGELFFLKLEGAALVNQGILGKQIQLLKCGSRRISYDTAWYRKLAGIFEKIKNTVAAYKKQAVLLYVILLFAGILAGLLLTFSGHVEGRVDQIEEWEYVRSILSAGVFLSFIPVTGYLFYHGQKEKSNCQKEISSRR